MSTIKSQTDWQSLLSFYISCIEHEENYNYSLKEGSENFVLFPINELKIDTQNNFTELTVLDTSSLKSFFESAMTEESQMHVGVPLVYSKKESLFVPQYFSRVEIEVVGEHSVVPLRSNRLHDVEKILSEHFVKIRIHAASVMKDNTRFLSFKGFKDKQTANPKDASLRDVIASLARMNDSVKLSEDNCDCNFEVIPKVAIFVAEDAIYSKKLKEELRYYSSRRFSELMKTSPALDILLNGRTRDGTKCSTRDADTENAVQSVEEKYIYNIVKMDDSQRAAIQNAMHSTLSVVAGPPGTGKTQTIINMVANCVMNGMNMLVVSKNNHAVENIIDEFSKKQIDYKGFIRLGNRMQKERGISICKNTMHDLEKGVLHDSVLDGGQSNMRLTEETLAGMKNLSREINTLQCVFDDFLQTRRDMGVLDQEIKKNKSNLFGLFKMGGNFHEFEYLFDQASFDKNTYFSAVKSLKQLSDDCAKIKNRYENGIFWKLLKTVSMKVYDKRIVRDFQKRRAFFEERYQTAHGEIPALYRDFIATFAPPSDFSNVSYAISSLEAVYDAFWTISNIIQKSAQMEKLKQKAVEGKPTKEQLSQLEDKTAAYDRLERVKMGADLSALKNKWLSQVSKSFNTDKDAIFRYFATEERMRREKLPVEDFKAHLRNFPVLTKFFPVVACSNLSIKGSVPGDFQFELAVLDEASQSDIASVIPILMRSRRVCIIGDENQLRHVSKLTHGEEKSILRSVNGAKNASWMHGDFSFGQVSAFGRAKGALADDVMMLNNHYRCEHDIIQFCNENFYDGRLRILTHLGRKGTEEEMRTTTRRLYPKNIEKLEICGKTEYKIGSAFNLGEAETTVEEAVRIISACLEMKLYNCGNRIGIITPFRSQKELIESIIDGLTGGAVGGNPDKTLPVNKLGKVRYMHTHPKTHTFSDSGNPHIQNPYIQTSEGQAFLSKFTDARNSQDVLENMRRIRVGTIHTFQGVQKDIMLFSAVVSQNARQGTIGWFDEYRNLVNVAVSRARLQMILLCDENVIKQSGIMGELVSYIERIEAGGHAED
ncbi:MAG: DEAD/DEAH box helicase [Thermoplasmata archaeon]